MKPRDFTRWPVAEGYADRQSVMPGEAVDLRCSSRTPLVRFEVARVGARREVVWSADDVAVGDHPTPADAWATGCGWPVAVTIPTGASWRSGLYEVRIEAVGADGPRAASEAFFVVRGRPEQPIATRLVLSTNTWNAYNQWGGRCLYSGAGRVSFGRPLERGYLRRQPAADGFDGRIASIVDPPDTEHVRLQEYQAAGDYPLWTASSGWHNWERRFVSWAERSGYEFDYAVDSDLETDDALDGASLLVTVGHSEYWTWAMRDRVDRFVERGGNWAIFSGNTCFWQVRLENDGQTMVCHKMRAHDDDPVAGTADAHLLTSLWSDPSIGRPENLTTGLSFTRGGYHRVGDAVPRGSGAYEVHRPDHWAFAGTGLREGDLLGAGSFIVGYEVDGCLLTLRDGLPAPTGGDATPETFDVLGSAPAKLISINAQRCEAPAALWAGAEPPGDLEQVSIVMFGDASPENSAHLSRGRAVMGVFTKGGGTVFNAGSADWAYGLDGDQLTQRITANVLDTLGN